MDLGSTTTLRPRYGLFPLTPALSPGERENGLQHLEYLEQQRFEREPIGHSLPKGEGWGEGEVRAACNKMMVVSNARQS